MLYIWPGVYVMRCLYPVVFVQWTIAYGVPISNFKFNKDSDRMALATREADVKYSNIQNVKTYHSSENGPTSANSL